MNNKNILKLVNQKFADEEKDFKIHFPVLLIERKVIENLFGNKFFNNVLIKDDHNQELAYEWDKVNKIYDKFDKNIVKFLKNGFVGCSEIFARVTSRFLWFILLMARAVFLVLPRPSG